MSKFVDSLAEAAGGGVVGLASNILGGIFDDLFGSGPDSRDLMNHQYDLQRKLMGYQSELNSPQHIAEQFAQAGFNPFVAMGSGAGSSGGQVSGGQISIPESGYETIPSTLGLLTADTLSKLAGAYKTAKEGSVVQGVAGSQMFKNYAEGLGASARANLDRIEADFKQTYGDAMYKGQISKFAAEVAELYQRCNLHIAEGNFAEAQTANEQLKQIINKELGNQEEFKTKMLEQRLKVYPQMLDLEIKNQKAEVEKKKAETVQGYGVAAYQQAQADYQNFMNKVYQDKDVRSSLVKQLQQLGDQAEVTKQLTNEQVSQVKWATEKLKKATDNFEIQMYGDMLIRLLGVTVQGIGEASQYMLAKRFLTPPTQNPIITNPNGPGHFYMRSDGVPTTGAGVPIVNPNVVTQW